MNSNHHGLYLFCIVALLIISVPLILNAQGIGMPFGGRITAVQPCNDGLLLYVLQPMKGVGTFRWYWGELPYLMHVPPHPGQLLLGMASYIQSPCMLAYINTGQGFPIIYHGDSI